MKEWEKELYIYRLTPAPPPKKDLQEYIDLYLAEKDNKYIAWFLHYYEPTLNDTVFEVVQRYSMFGHFLDIKEACVLGIIRALEEYTDTAVPFITFKTRIMWEEIHNYIRTMRTGFTVQSDDEYRNLRNIMRLYAAYNSKNDADTLKKISDEIGLSAKTVTAILQGGFRNMEFIDFYRSYADDDSEESAEDVTVDYTFDPCRVLLAKEKTEAVMENSQQTDDGGKEVQKTDERDADLGSREVLRRYDELVFKPAEADVSINLGWFWHNNLYYLFKKKRTAEKLADIYFKTVGGNASLLLNIPPNKDGLIDKREIRTLQKFTSLINEPFRSEIKDFRLTLIADDETERAYPENGSCTFRDDESIVKISFEKSQKVSTVVIREDLCFSQRVESFRLYAKSVNGYTEIYKGTVIGSKKIVRLNKKVQTDEILFAVTGTRGNPVIRDIAFYN